MDRREDKRRPYRIQVRYWTGGIKKPSLGYTMNISSSGMYITTNRLLTRRTRVRVEMRSGEGRGVMVEGVVARSERSTSQIMPNTMAVRFLTPRELVGELVPQVGSSSARRSPTREGVYRVRFDDPRQYLEVYHRDLATGGLFVPTDRPAPLRDEVTVELEVADAAPMRLEGRVVHRLEPTEGNLLAGMGLELSRFDEVSESLRMLAASVDQGSVG